MNSFEWALIQFLLSMGVFVAIVLFMVIAPIVLISAKLNDVHKKREQADANKTPATPSAASAVVSQEDGRVIAMEASDAEAPASAAAKPPKEGINLVKDVLLPVAGKAVVAIAAHQFKHRHHK